MDFGSELLHFQEAILKSVKVLSHGYGSPASTLIFGSFDTTATQTEEEEEEVTFFDAVQ